MYIYIYIYAYIYIDIYVLYMYICYRRLQKTFEECVFKFIAVAVKILFLIPCQATKFAFNLRFISTYTYLNTNL